MKRPILADARYDSQTVSKFINALMLQGKKSTAERIFYGAMDLVESRDEPAGRQRVQAGAVEHQAGRRGEEPPRRRRHVPGAGRSPSRAPHRARHALADLVFARAQREVDAEKLAAEIIAASKGEGNAIKKKEDTHRMAEANKAFAHYRW